ncbi:hypothetical protein G7Y89_g3230 [Cudoniella acicularis]|uniref:Ribosomal RNA methyltransferase FtsJ domain-containing protein n=1 Tax=Cudoniella acicularis TaxID=354080 RepID=A0A8H4RTQ3_9HELO|nr:hypothetical protein G7Y89_g3230 [Cudoniella acicularis]
MTFDLDIRASTGFSNASHYDTHRPSYPSAAVDKLLKNLGVFGVKDARIVDLASGTGKFTELLVGREEEFEVVAVEPQPQMRGELVKKDLKGVKVVDGDAANMPLEDGWGDSLVAAQVSDLFLGLPFIGKSQGRHGKWREVFEKQQDTTPFQTLKDTFTGNLPRFSLPLGEEDLEWTVFLSDEAIWDRYSTLSQIANLKGKDGRFEEIRKEVFEALKGEDTERNDAGEVAIHGRTHLAWTSRI